MENDTLIFFGDAVKALDDKGRVGGYLVRFSPDGKHKDLTGEYFDAKSYLGPSDGDGAECLFDHGYAVPAEDFNKNISAADRKALQELADRTFTPIKTKRDSVGIFAETVLSLEDEYEKFIFSRVKAGRVGWSSGSSGHRVVKNTNGYISRWPISEGSLTPRPCQPLSVAIPMKSLASLKFVGINDDGPANPIKADDDVIKSLTLAARLTRRLDDLIDDGHDKVETIKQMAREAMCEVAEVEAVLDGTKRRPSNAHLKAFARVLGTPYEMLRSLAERQRKDPQSVKSALDDMITEETAEGPCFYELLNYYSKIAKDIGAMARASQTTGTPFDLNAKVGELAIALVPYLQNTTVAQITDWLEPEGSGEGYDPDAFYLKAITKIDTDTFRNLTKGIDLDTHSELVVSAFRDISARLKNNQLARANQKAGREISDKNRARAADILAALKQSVSDFESWLESTKPMATDEAMRAVQTRQLARRSQRRQAQLGA